MRGPDPTCFGAMTKSHFIRDSAEMMSSTTPCPSTIASAQRANSRRSTSMIKLSN
jgi:hypothetical protein